MLIWALGNGCLGITASLSLDDRGNKVIRLVIQVFAIALGIVVLRYVEGD